MKKTTDNTLFALIHDYFKIYLPKQRKCSPNTIRAYQIAIESLLDFVKAEKNIGLIDITFEMVNRNMLGAFLDELEEKRSWTVSTRNHRLQCIRAFYAYAAEIDPMVITCRDDILKVPIAKVDESDIVEHMSEAAIKALWEQPNVSTSKGMRDQFLMMLLYDSAARIQELLDIKLGDIRFGTPTTLMLNGKGRKVRTVTIMEKTVEYLRDYLRVFHADNGSQPDQYLFYVIRNGKRKRMCEDNARRFIHTYGVAAKTVCSETPNKVRPHMFRHSRAMHLYQHGMPLSIISELLGHAQLETTLIYARADTELKRKAIESATAPDSPLKEFVDAERYRVNDDETIKRLYGLK